MIQNLTNIYHSPDLTGDFLTAPLINYNELFAHEGSKFSKVVLLIIQVATGILAYPIFGLLAALGIWIKSRHISEINKHNGATKAQIDIIALSFFAKSAAHGLSEGDDQKNYRQEIIKEYAFDVENAARLADSAKKQVDFYTQRYRKVYFHASGLQRYKIGEFQVILALRQRA